VAGRRDAAGSARPQSRSASGRAHAPACVCACACPREPILRVINGPFQFDFGLKVNNGFLDSVQSMILKKDFLYNWSLPSRKGSVFVSNAASVAVGVDDIVCRLLKSSYSPHSRS